MISDLLKKLFARLSPPLLFREGLGVGLFLLLGSVRLIAQNDPFPPVVTGDYSGNMTYIVKVVMGDEALTDGIVAFYKDDVIRGKASIGNVSGYPELSLVMVSGNAQKESLYARVYTGNHVIEVAPENLEYSFNGEVGSWDAPYILSLPDPIVTTPTKEGWATTCLPFAAEVPKGVEVWNATAIENGELVMSKVMTGTILPANTPVLVKSKGKTSYEWLSKVYYDNGSLITTEPSLLKGTIEPREVATKSVLTLGYSNEGRHALGFWLFTGTSLRAHCAYIADFPADSRGVTFRLDDATGITAIDNGTHPAPDHCYDLSGRKWSNVHQRPKGLMKKGSHGQRIRSLRIISNTSVN